MKTQITRQELKQIYDIACSGWKPKLEKFASKDPFSEIIKFKEDQIKEMISACTAEQLPTVKVIFDIQDTFEGIKSVEDACKYLGEPDDEVITLRLLQKVPNLARNVVAEQELVCITKALNEKEDLDWDDSNVYKYFIWWNLGKNFRLHDVDCDSRDSAVSARLCYKSIELASYSSEQFKSTWNDYMNK